MPRIVSVESIDNGIKSRVRLDNAQILDIDVPYEELTISDVRIAYPVPENAHPLVGQRVVNDASGFYAAVAMMLGDGNATIGLQALMALDKKWPAIQNAIRDEAWTLALAAIEIAYGAGDLTQSQYDSALSLWTDYRMGE